MNTKVCRVCGQEKSISLFSINRSRVDGKHYNCKPCDSKKTKKWYVENKEKARKRSAKHRENNIELYKESERNRYAKNRENELIKRKEYYINNKEIVVKRVSLWRSKNRDKTRLYIRTNYQKNKPEYMAKCAIRRATKLNATPSWLTAIQLAQIQEMYDVALAKSVQTGIDYHVDHIHPLQGNGFNGLHVPWNLQVIEAHENLIKGNKLPHEDTSLSWEC